MEFGDFRISLLSLSIYFTDIELVAESPITILLLGIIFPSAVVQKFKPSAEYPTSKITIARMKVGLRMGLIVRNFDKHDGAITFLSKFTKQLLDLIFLRPVISIKLNRATFHIEKLYLAPRPPPEMMMNNTTSLPSAIAPANIGSEIPVFDQDYMLDFLRLDEVRNADYVTFYMERWREFTICDPLYRCPFQFALTLDQTYLDDFYITTYDSSECHEQGGDDCFEQQNR